MNCANVDKNASHHLGVKIWYEMLHLKSRLFVKTKMSKKFLQVIIEETAILFKLNNSLEIVQDA